MTIQDYCPSDEEFMIYGKFFQNPKFYEKAKSMKTARYHYMHNLIGAEKIVRQKLKNQKGNPAELLYYLYYISAVRAEKLGYYDLAKEKYRKGLNHCFYMANEYGIGNREFQTLYSSFRLRKTFYDRYKIPDTLSNFNSSFYDYDITTKSNKIDNYINYSKNKFNQLKIQEFAFRKIYGLANSIYRAVSREDNLYPNGLVKLCTEDDFKNFYDGGYHNFTKEEKKELISIVIQNLLYIVNNSDFDLVEESLFKLGQVHFEQKNFLEANNHFNYLLEKFPASYLADDAFVFLICIKNEMGKTEEKQKMIQKLKTDYKGKDLAIYFQKYH